MANGWDGLLDPGEEILWQGRPEARFDWSMILRRQTLQGLFMAAFALFWIGLALQLTRAGEAPLLIRIGFPLFGLPFLAIGLDTAFGAPWRALRRLRATTYTLTSRHALIATDIAGKRKLNRLPLGPGLFPALEEGDPGSVWLGPEVAPQGGWSGKGAGGTYFGLNAAPGRAGFELIPEARRIHRMILDAQAKLAAAPQKTL